MLCASLRVTSLAGAGLAGVAAGAASAPLSVPWASAMVAPVASNGSAAAPCNRVLRSVNDIGTSKSALRFAIALATLHPHAHPQRAGRRSNGFLRQRLVLAWLGDRYQPAADDDAHAPASSRRITPEPRYFWPK